MNKIFNFGYTKVTSKEKTELVQKVFSDVSKNYDLMNDIMSLGAHRLWKKKFVDLVDPLKDDKIIDVGSGSGDIIIELLKKNININIDVVDLNYEMINIGKKRIKNKKVNFHINNAEKLKFENNSFDKYLISFCLRNVSNIDKSLNEAFRILKPGGKYFCLEFSKPKSFFISKIYNKYKANFIPLVGKLVADNKAAYNYLNESIDLFPNQNQLKVKLTKAGFINVSYINLFNGIVTIHKGYKL